MKLHAVALGVFLCASSALANTSPPAVSEWGEQARFFGGLRTGVAIPPGGRGLAPSMAVELGVAAHRGVGFGLHLMGMANPPPVPSMRIGKADYGLGAAADVRFYFQTVAPLTLYPTFSAGFLAGPETNTGVNAVLPLFNLGFGARLRLGEVYTSFEFGVASFQIPFVAVAIGWESARSG